MFVFTRTYGECLNLIKTATQVLGKGLGYTTETATAAVYAVCATYRGGVRLIRLVSDDDGSVAAFKHAREAFNRGDIPGGGDNYGGVYGGGGVGGGVGGGGAHGHSGGANGGGNDLPPSYSPVPGPTDLPLIYPRV